MVRHHPVHRGLVTDIPGHHAHAPVLGDVGGGRRHVEQGQARYLLRPAIRPSNGRARKQLARQFLAQKSGAAGDYDMHASHSLLPVDRARRAGL